jgi:hypothetical protein
VPAGGSSAARLCLYTVALRGRSRKIGVRNPVVYTLEALLRERRGNETDGAEAPEAGGGAAG